MANEYHPDHAPPTENAAKRRRGKRARLKRANRRLRERLGRYHKLFLASTALAVLLALTLGFIALQEPEPAPVPLGTGKAGLKTPVAAVADTVAERAAPLAAEPPASAEAPAPAAGRAIVGGEASYYGSELAGNPTASGERFNPGALTAAHRTLPFGSRVRVTNRRNGESVVVRINDRGPFHGNRVIDLSLAAAREIGLARAGTGPVRLELLR